MTRLFIIFLFSQLTLAQDVHYSQFDKTKSLLNPSLISSLNDDYEIQIQRRSQWSSVSIPFTTFTISFNAKDVYKKTSLAGTILSDKAGDSYFSTNGVSFSVANTFLINDNLLSIGLQSALYQRSVNYDALIFLENENLQNPKFLFFDIGLGLSNYKILNSNSALLLGISYFHINKPRQSLVSNNQVLLKPKYILHSTYYTAISSQINISPTLYSSSQDQAKEFIIGTDFIYKLNDEFNFISGIYSRINDAFFLTIGVQKAKVEAIISYDINTSTLANASNFLGGVEFSISYGWSVFKQSKDIKNRICPIYL